jgi:hypothetical protein
MLDQEADVASLGLEAVVEVASLQARSMAMSVASISTSGIDFSFISCPL